MTKVNPSWDAMTKAERRRYLLDHGWERITADTWRRPETPSHFYSLAAAIRRAVADELAET